LQVVNQRLYSLLLSVVKYHFFILRLPKIYIKIFIK
jgi:hypothetical protein